MSVRVEEMECLCSEVLRVMGEVSLTGLGSGTREPSFRKMSFAEGWWGVRGVVRVLVLWERLGVEVWDIWGYC